MYECHFGTKRLIEKFHNEVIKSIQFIYYYKGSRFSAQQKFDFFSETRHSYGRTALLLSGGATFGRFHIGVIKALNEQDLLPRIICGSSVGSIIAAYVCCHSLEELSDVLKIENYIDKPLLKFKHESLWQLVMSFAKGESVLDTDHLKELIRDVIGDITFKEVHDRFKWCLNITVTHATKTDEGLLLNYMTSPNVLIWSAVSASTAIPRFFDPVELMVKTDSGEILPYYPDN